MIVLSARTDSSDKVEALDTGADDYVTKPFGMDEFLARLRAAVRRATATAGAEQPVIETDSFTVDLAAKRVIKDGAEVHLTPTEWGMLEVLVRNRGKLVGREELLTEIRGAGPCDRDHTTCASTWRSCGASSKTIRPTPNICSPSRHGLPLRGVSLAARWLCVDVRRRQMATGRELTQRWRDPVQDVMLADRQLVDAGPLTQFARQLLNHDRATADHVGPALVHRRQRGRPARVMPISRSQTSSSSPRGTRER